MWKKQNHDFFLTQSRLRDDQDKESMAMLAALYGFAKALQCFKLNANISLYLEGIHQTRLAWKLACLELDQNLQCWYNPECIQMLGLGG